MGGEVPPAFALFRGRERGLVTLYDLYFFDDVSAFDPEIFTDIIGRHFKEPEEGLGFDGSPTAHMWRTMIWPNNFL